MKKLTPEIITALKRIRITCVPKPLQHDYATQVIDTSPEKQDLILLDSSGLVEFVPYSIFGFHAFTSEGIEAFNVAWES